MLVYYMISRGTHPFEAANVEAKIANGQPDLSSVTNRLALDLVGKMLEENPANRPSVTKLLRYSHYSLFGLLFICHVWPYCTGIVVVAKTLMYCGRCRNLKHSNCSNLES